MMAQPRSTEHSLHGVQRARVNLPAEHRKRGNICCQVQECAGDLEFKGAPAWGEGRRQGQLSAWPDYTRCTLISLMSQPLGAGQRRGLPGRGWKESALLTLA